MPLEEPAPLRVDDVTRVRREPHRQVTDRAALDAILDEALLAHVAVIRDGLPLVLPLAVARDGDWLLLHGSTGAGGLPPGAADLAATFSCLRAHEAFLPLPVQANAKYVPAFVADGTVTVLENLRDLPPLVRLTLEVPRRLPDFALFLLRSE